MEIEILDEKNKMQHTPSQYLREFVNKIIFEKVNFRWLFHDFSMAIELPKL